MKHFFLSLRAWPVACALLGAAPLAQAQTVPTPPWQAALAGSQTTGTSFVLGSAPDGQGNVYVAGYFRGTLTLGTATLVSAGEEDGFVAKWNPATNSFAWAQRLGGARAELITGVAASASGVYVTGYFNGVSTTLGNSVLTNADATGGSADVFVAKLADAGTAATVSWAQRAGGPGFDRANAVAAVGANVYVTGFFSSATADFGNLTLINSDATPTISSNDVFVGKLTDGGSSGAWAWARQAGGPGFDVAWGVAASGQNVYVTGNFANSAARFGSTTLATAGETDVFVAKITDVTGPVFAWALRAGGPGPEESNAVAVAGANVYLAGAFTGAASVFGSTTLSSAGAFNSSDIFIAKVADEGAAGRFGWAQRAGGPGPDAATGVAASGTSVYATGAFRPVLTMSGPLNTATFGAATLTNAGEADVFVSKLADGGNSGAFVWTQQAGATFNDLTATATLSGNRVAVAGNFSSLSLGFGSQSLSNPRGGASLVGNPLAFVAALADPALPLSNHTPAAGGADLVGAAVYPNPARAAATLRVPAVPGADRALVSVSNLVGQVVYSQWLRLPATGAATVYLPVQHLPAGLYQLQVRAGEQRTTRTLGVE